MNPENKNTTTQPTENITDPAASPDFVNQTAEPAPVNSFPSLESVVAKSSPEVAVILNRTPATGAVSGSDTTAVDSNKQRHFLAAFFFSLMFGLFGVDRFYLGKYWTGILKLLTFGGLGVWAMIDLQLIMSGAMRDKQGNTLLQAERYKKFANWTVFLFSAIIIALIIVTGAVVYYTIFDLMQGGGMDNMMKMMQGGQNIDSSQIQKCASEYGTDYNQIMKCMELSK